MIISYRLFGTDMLSRNVGNELQLLAVS